MKNTFLFSIIFILLISSVAAISWPFSKAVTCQNFNISGINCETFWCNSIQEGNYSIEKELCVLQEIINNTIYVNATENNLTLNSSKFYNMSEVDAKIQDIKMNFTQKYLLINDFDEFKDDFKDNRNSGSGGITGSEIIIGLLVVSLVIGGFYFVNKQNQNKKKIEETGETSEEETMRKLLELKKLENKVKQKGRKK